MKRTIAALVEALDDEYKARATYAKVIETFGPIRPFVNIIEAEGRQAIALLRQFSRLAVDPPEDRWDGQILRFARCCCGYRMRRKIATYRRSIGG